jgi:Dyp-type peroxidase family
MKRGLDLADIQGNIVLPYGRFGFPVMRHFFFHIDSASACRNFVEQIRRAVTTGERWGAAQGAAKRPLVAMNIGFSYSGLKALELPTRTLSRMPEEFIDGMAKRWSILGDFGPSAVYHWDPIWLHGSRAKEQSVHIWVSFTAQIQSDGSPVPELEQRTEWLKAAAIASGGVRLLSGHKGPNPDYQEAAALMETMPDGSRVPVAREHFGFTDGIGDPTFVGQYAPEVEADEVVGSGKLRLGGEGWDPLAAGEFILGQVSEAQELPSTAPPWSFTRNGTFMAYRKLHQNVDSFRKYTAGHASQFRRVTGAASEEAARQTVLAKMAGRWQNGIPLAIAPTYEESEAMARQWADIPAIQLKGPKRTPAETARLTAYGKLLADFHYKDDVEGAKCPVSAHIRRANPRDALDPTFATPGAAPDSALTNRRRILRRGGPYGDSTNPDDQAEHGIIFMALCASLFRQFEFIQQQWMNYGASFHVGNDTDPIIGVHGPGAKFVIPADPAGAAPPFICANLPQFVETRGGEYFFLPSLTALREIAYGSVDPT